MTRHSSARAVGLSLFAFLIVGDFARADFNPAASPMIESLIEGGSRDHLVFKDGSGFSLLESPGWPWRQLANGVEMTSPKDPLAKMSFHVSKSTAPLPSLSVAEGPTAVEAAEARQTFVMEGVPGKTEAFKLERTQPSLLVMGNTDVMEIIASYEQEGRRFTRSVASWKRGDEVFRFTLTAPSENYEALRPLYRGTIFSFGFVDQLPPEFTAKPQ